MVNLIPVASKYERKDGYFIFPDEITLNSDIDLPLLKLKHSDNAVITVKADSSLSDEAYRLSIGEEQIVIYSSDKAGAYYALESLRQLSKYELGVRRVACCEIEDSPRYKWRGLQLDSSRHFWSVEQIKKYLDLMLMMKLNVFHWHLTDDQGWRIEIKKYPLLTEIGSVRPFTHINGWGSTEIINDPYGGFYTQEQIREIVDYAAERSIMVVPEIDFPAHAAAALAAYPEFACRELKRDVQGFFGGIIPEKVLGMKDWNRTICLGKESTISFVFDVIDEVCDLFPAPYFHIGGDEAPTDEWSACPECQRTIREHGLKNEDALQGWFNNRVLEHLKAKGKRLIGWNEILKADNIDSSVIAQYWTSTRDRNAERHANSGGDIIMSKHQAFYFDMPYALYPLENTYSFTPQKYGVKAECINSVIGVEGELWSEWIDDTSRLEFMMLPRLQALSEVAWSKEENRSFDDFSARLDEFKPLLSHLGLNYAVNKITAPKDLLMRSKIKKMFDKGDVHLEDKQNEIYKAKGEI